MNTKEQKIKNFNPNGVGVTNGRFIGLPFDEEDADIVLHTVPWDLTVSYGEGTATAAQNILDASPQLDLYDPHVKDAWKSGIYMRPLDQEYLALNKELRPKAKRYIDFLESGGKIESNPEMQNILATINHASEKLNQWVYEQTSALLNRGKLVGLVGGDHSSPLGFLKALSERYDDFGILQIDAHMDLRQAYEGFEYSHASIFYNALKLRQLSKLVQVGIRDYCEEEVTYCEASNSRVEVFFEHNIREKLYTGEIFHNITQEIIAKLPTHVYISFDIDGLDPKLCPNTGTPVAGGFDFQEVIYLFKMLLDSGKTIIGFDLSEVAGIQNEWDGNIGARILYKLCNFLVASHNKNGFY